MPKVTEYSDDDSTPPVQPPKPKPRKPRIEIDEDPIVTRDPNSGHINRGSIIVACVSLFAIAAIVVILVLTVNKTKEVAVPAEVKQAQAAKEKAQREQQNRQKEEQAKIDEKRAAEDELDRKEAQEKAARAIAGIMWGVGWAVGAIAYVACAVYIYRDATARGVPHGVLWVMLSLITSVLALIVYIFARPQSRLVQCGYCKQNCIWYKPKYVHCSHPLD